MLDHLVSRVGIMGDGSANTSQLVGGNGCSRSRPANNDAPVGASVEDRLGNRGGVVRVVDRIAGMSAQVVHGMTRFGEPGGQMLFEVVPGVVRADGDSHDRWQGSQERWRSLVTW